MKQLTKSDFLTYLEAPMHLWARKNNCIEKAMNTFDTHLIEQGYEVEKLAKQYLELIILKNPGHIELIWQKTYCDKSYQVKVDALLYNSSLQSSILWTVFEILT